MHTFLFRQADWQGSGIYLDQDGTEAPAKGMTKVIHGDDEWRVESEMIIGRDGSSIIGNTYTLEPWPGGEDSSPWESVNPQFGLLFGMITVVGDTILSRFVSEDGEYSGMESLTMTGDSTYEDRGALFKRDKKISSWSMELRKR